MAGTAIFKKEKGIETERRRKRSRKSVGRNPVSHYLPSTSGITANPSSISREYVPSESRKFTQKWTDILYKSFEDRGHIQGGYKQKGAGPKGGMFGNRPTTFTSGLFSWQSAVSPALRAKTAQNYQALSYHLANPTIRSHYGRTLTPVVSSKLGPGTTWMKHPNLDLARSSANTNWMSRLTRADKDTRSNISKDTTKEMISTAETRFGESIDNGFENLGVMSAKTRPADLAHLFRMNTYRDSRRIKRNIL